jgi:xanthine dehydrogenase accessory factor
MAVWLEALAACERNVEPAVLLTVLSVRGSVPREAGCKMVVTRDSLFGTIGGGNLEFQCTRVGRALLADGAVEPVQQSFPLGPALGQCCGGHVSVLFEFIRPAALQVAVFGAGHVGRALVRLLTDLPCQVRWFDSRPDAFPATSAPNVMSMVVPEPDRGIESLPAGAFVLVMTHDHQLDFAITAAALCRTDFLGVGLIGSDTKRARFTSRLRRRGLNDAAIDRLICPIGVPGIDSKVPEAIAIAVAAQILQACQSATKGSGVISARSEPAIPTNACGLCAAAGMDACV